MSKIIIDRTRHINAPIETVFNLISDPDALKPLHINQREHDYDGQAMQVGLSWHETSSFMGREITSTITVTAVEKPVLLTTASVSDSSEGSGTWKLSESADGQTVLEVHIEGVAKGFFAGLAMSLVKSNFEKLFDQYLDNIVAEAERLAVSA